MAGSIFECCSTRIITAIKESDLEGLKSALKDGEDPHFKDRKGNTYLHYISSMHRPFLFHILVGTHIDLNAQNRHGNTALHVTALQNECCLVGSLLAAGIDPTIRNKDGKTAAEIKTKNLYWKSIYDKYMPGIFKAAEDHDVDKFMHLLHCWSRVDTLRNGQTLRQFAASRKFHDLVFHIDTQRHTLCAIYAVLERDAEKAWKFLSHVKCDVNYLNYACESKHILQDALGFRDLRLVRMICRSRINVNITVRINGHLKAPLFFAALDPSLPPAIMWTVLRAGADFTLKDQRGRNAAIYALDRSDRSIDFEVISYMIKNGLDIASRDATGTTLRDVARFARRKDIVTLINKVCVKLIRASNIEELHRLCVMGYESLIFQFNYRDTFIYSSGNETEEVLNLTQGIPSFFALTARLHYGIQHWSLGKIQEMLGSAEYPHLLVNARDRGGRSPLHICVMYWRADVLQLMTSQAGIDVSARDNLGRTAYHYACAVEEEDERKELCFLLEKAGVDVGCHDWSGWSAQETGTSARSDHWLAKERKTRYGMKKQLSCVDKYEELCRLLRGKGKTLRHFCLALRGFRYPVPKFSHILPQLMPEYQDLLFVAMENDKEDIAVRLIQLGSDWRLKESCNVISSRESPADIVMMSVRERAEQLGMNKLIAAIDSKIEYLKCKASESDRAALMIVEKSETEKSRKIQVVRRISGSDSSIDDTQGNGVQDVFFEEEVLEDSDDEADEQSCRSDSDNGENDKAMEEDDFYDEEFEYYEDSDDSVEGVAS